MLPGNYQLRQIAIVRPRKELVAGFHGERFELVAFYPQSQELAEPIVELKKPPGDTESWSSEVWAARSNVLSRPFGPQIGATLEAKQGQPNVWSVRLPDELDAGEVRRSSRPKRRSDFPSVLLAMYPCGSSAYA